MTGFVYGNTRLRARSARLVAADLAALDGRPLDTIAAALLAPATPDALQQAVTRRLGQELTEVRSFYREHPARTLIDALLAGYDRHNLLTLLRGRGHDAPAALTLTAIVPVGALGGPAAMEVAGQPDLPAAAALLREHRLPDPDTAAVLPRAVQDLQLHADFATLEATVVRAHAVHRHRQVAAIGAAGAPLADMLSREADQIDALAALRLRDDPEGAAAGKPVRYLLTGGRLTEPMLAAVAGSADRAGAAALLTDRRPEWQDALTGWVRHGLFARLADQLIDLRTRAARAWSVRDPLGVGVPIGYVAAVETENRALRRAIEAAARPTGIPAPGSRREGVA